MTTITCPVCGAAVEPGVDRTCPVCGADLPTVPDDPVRPDAEAEPDEAGPDPADATPPPTADELPPAPTFADDTAATGAPAPPPPPTGPSAPSGDPASPAGGSTVPPPPPGGPTPVAPSRPSPHDPSHPSGLSSSLRTYGMLTHLSVFVAAIVGMGALAFVGPLIMWLVRRDQHPFVDHHGKEALNFNLSLLLYFVVGVVVSIATVGVGLVVVLPAAAVFVVTWIVCTILAAVKANAGEGFRYPLTIRFVGDDV